MKKNDLTIKGWQRILLLIFPYIIVVGFFELFGLYISGANMTNIYSPKSSLQHLIVKSFSLSGTLLLLWAFVRMIDNEPFKSIGFDEKKRFLDIVFGFFLGLVIMGIAFLLLNSLNCIKYDKINYKGSELIISIFVFLVVAFLEEVLFRGYVLRNLMYSFNMYIALIFSSFLFSIMHGFNPNMDWFSYLNLFLAGILLGLTYIFTKNLWFPIALHFSWNFFQSLFGFNVSGQDFYSLIEFKMAKPNLFNGGLFGFEGSIFCIVIQLVLITSILIYYNKSALYNIKR